MRSVREGSASRHCVDAHKRVEGKPFLAREFLREGVSELDLIVGAQVAGERSPR